MRTNIFMTLLATFVLTIAACGSDADGSDQVSAGSDDDTAAGGDAAAGGTMPSLAGGWILTNLVVDGQQVELPAGADGVPLAPEMTIEAGQVSGDGGCNQFGGTIDIASADSVSFGDLFMTEMACEPFELMDFEQVYVGALSTVTSWSAGPDGVTFSHNETTLNYKAAAPIEPTALLGSSWQLDSIYLGEGVERAVSSSDQSVAPASLVITEGMATLTADGCEPFEFGVEVAAGIDGPFQATDTEGTPSCDNANMAAAWDGIRQASGFMINENRLTFIGLPGETVGFVDRP